MICTDRNRKTLHGIQFLFHDNGSCFFPVFVKLLGLFFSPELDKLGKLATHLSEGKTAEKEQTLCDHTDVCNPLCRRLAVRLDFVLNFGFLSRSFGFTESPTSGFRLPVRQSR